MIVFFENGRLGNQLFQYAALKELYPNHRLVFFGCRDLNQALHSVDAIIIKRNSALRWLIYLLERLFFALASLRIIGTIEERRDHGSFAIKKVSGAIFSTYLLKNSFFQNKNIVERIQPHFALNANHCKKATEWLNEKVVQLSDKTFIFVHIRRADYLTWPNREHPAVLDAQWYIKGMDHFRERVNNPIFLILTDDPDYARKYFGHQPDVLFTEGDKFIDLALMSLCQNGILSASSFAWWGAWFSKARSREAGIYIAPKYWVGHRTKKWYPEGFATQWITYIE